MIKYLHFWLSTKRFHFSRSLNNSFLSYHHSKVSLHFHHHLNEIIQSSKEKNKFYKRSRSLIFEKWTMLRENFANAFWKRKYYLDEIILCLLHKRWIVRAFFSFSLHFSNSFRLNLFKSQYPLTKLYFPWNLHFCSIHC